MKNFVIFCFVLTSTFSSLFGNLQSDAKGVQKKLFELAYKQLYRDEEFSNHKLNEVLAHFKGGKWEDIDYSNSASASWQPADHWKRLYIMAKAFNNPQSSYCRNMELSKKILSGIKFWIYAEPAFSCPNYWWNAIGVPLDMGKVIVMMYDQIPASDLTKAVQVMNLGVKPDMYDYHGKATGQNLLWLTYVHIYTSCFTRDEAGLERAFSAAKNEIRITDAEGIQHDFSFHQHGAQFYSFGYGRVFTLTAAQLFYLSQNSAYAFPREKVDILAGYILEGQQWLTRNKFLEYTAMGREISRGQIDANSILYALTLLSKGDPERKSEFETFAQQLSTGIRTNPLIGNRYFPRVDLMVQQRKNYYFSLKATSDRIIGSESGNGENLKGFYQGQGTCYLVKTGEEYKNIFPLWNWKQLPGSLCLQDSKPLPLFDWGKGTKGATSFVYGLSDGLYGCFAYDYAKDEVIAKRSWSFFDDEIVCMISGVETKSSDHLFQNINQTILNGDVWVDGAKQSKDSMKYKSVSKVYHDSVGYIFGDNRYPVILEKSVKSGNWKSLNIGGSSDILTKRLFSLNADLGSEVRNGSLCYTVLPDISLSDFEKYKIENVITILQNDAAVHAVYHKKLNQLQALFFEPATLKLPWKDLKVNFLHPGLLIIRKLENKIIVNYSQPTEKKEIVIDLNVKTKVENQDLTIF